MKRTFLHLLIAYYTSGLWLWSLVLKAFGGEQRRQRRRKDALRRMWRH
jgi:hypothetical protein